MKKSDFNKFYRKDKKSNSNLPFNKILINSPLYGKKLPENINRIKGYIAVLLILIFSIFLLFDSKMEEKNPEIWLKKRCDMGYGNSCAKLGIYYIENENIKLGREYIKKACEVKHKWRTCKHTNKQWD
ncbi:hypothetical protein [Campylobacter ureolyticus]|uniref:Beta-lactamase n=1 Tax=Campylobacter ureolyticus TaxID=827 RepID=A0AAE7JPB4_9BACT|nr:hypothetical protein [Campylobacter ureolyticus]MCR8685443.1 hypothetical protein [Campylobacter ureolyticus]QKF84221.1 hypothetical protein CURT_0729 [Campylobacter ureolyticus]QQY35620.1 hypothetical protein I6I59_08915 [Campylobacter ureolyticus]SUX23661.1 Uncharacterised protein [Campylobacter ureolyticus]